MFCNELDYIVSARLSRTVIGVRQVQTVLAILMPSPLAPNV